MKARLSRLSIIAAGLALVLVWNVSARGAENPGSHPSIPSTGPFIVYLPLVQLDYTTPCTLAPTLISPTNGSALDTLILHLTYMRGTYPVSYTVISIDDDPAFNLPIQYYTYGGTKGPLHLTLFSNLDPATKYYWRVYDVCDSVQSPYSSTFNFTTGSGGVILPAPTLVSPADGTVGIGEQTTLTWNTVGSAVGYELYICSGGCYLFFTTSTSQMIDYLDPNTTYQWYVQTYNNYAYGNTSAIWQFSTGSFSSSQEDVRSLQLAAPYTRYQPADGTLTEIKNRP